VLVCDPRKNTLLKVGNKSDRIDSRKLAELLRSNLLRSVYHEQTGVRTVKELARSYMTISKDLTRVMSRLQRIRERGRESVSAVYGMSERYSASGARRRASSCRMHAGFKLKEEI
jgi:transposase